MDKALDFRVMENRTVTVLVQSDMSSVLLLTLKKNRQWHIRKVYVRQGELRTETHLRSRCRSAHQIHTYGFRIRIKDLDYTA